MTTPRRRTTEPHSRHDRRRSSFSPVEKRAMTSASSATCSTISASSIGSSQGMSKVRMTTAAAMPSPR